MKIEGSVAIITGAGSGIGRAASIELALRGAKIALVDLSEKGIRETLKSIAEALTSSKRKFDQENYLVCPCDVTNTQSLEQIFESVNHYFGKIDIVANNAGIVENPFEFHVPETSAEIEEVRNRWKKVLEIDLDAVINGTYIAIRYMKVHGGVVINTASMAGIVPTPGTPTYGAAKAGVVNFTRSLGFLGRSTNIRVNAICPGFVETPILRDIPRDGMIQLEGGILTTDMVVKGILELIEDDTKMGAIQKITFKRGITYHDSNPRRAQEADANKRSKL
eukprot:TRINITY_DN741_c0_g1_i1.p1 TRINITY_DN741_c0_g1~~TRINITY_DN741_c0_g1_i1.p1  ORF type:complete len:278 (-),score=58.78 TRINITY_DN741_c0_g1_i1:60-893(-)